MTRGLEHFVYVYVRQVYLVVVHSWYDTSIYSYVRYEVPSAGILHLVCMIRTAVTTEGSMIERHHIPGLQHHLPRILPSRQSKVVPWYTSEYGYTEQYSTRRICMSCRT